MGASSHRAVPELARRRHPPRPHHVGAERGAQVVRSQRYDVKRAVVQGDRVALEMTWTAVLAVPVGTLSAGDEMRAHLAMFVDVSDGKISAQRNYDCFEPF
jgi:ketosteroid isomerase-like protein